METVYRRARAQEMEVIYLMGFDVWAGGASIGRYVEGCSNSPKYRAGDWYVLLADGTPVSSLLVHTFPSWGPHGVRGIGSVATDPVARRKGFARRIMHCAIDDCTHRAGAEVLLLYSDIGPAFYTSLGFVPLPEPYQGAPGSVLMARLASGLGLDVVERYREAIPGYF